jgi:hypothetical protein
MLEATTAEELVVEALPEGSGTPSPDAIARALVASQSGGLSADVVWRRAWEVSFKGEADVAMLAEHLSHDGSFLAQVALRLDAATVTAATALLQHTLTASAASFTPQQRLQLLAMSDLAMTYRQIHGNTADMTGLRALVDAGPAEAAAAFARTGNVTAVQTLFHHHPRAIAVGGGALSVLSNLPPSVSPYEYLPLLKELAAQELPAQLRAPDPVEAPENLEFLQCAGPQLSECALAALGPVFALPTSEEVDAWVLERAKVVDDEGGLAATALSLLKAWAASGHMTVATPAVALHMWLAMLKHECGSRGGANLELADMPVREFLSMSAPAQLRLALVTSLPEALPTSTTADIITEVGDIPPCLSVTPPFHVPFDVYVLSFVSNMWRYRLRGH